MTSSVTWFDSHVVLNIKPSKIFSVMAEQIEAKLYSYDCLSIRNKKFSTFDIIDHKVWELRCFWRINILKSSSPKWLDRSRGNFTYDPQTLGIPGCSRIINRSHDLAAILVWKKTLKKKSFSWTASSIDMKRHNCDLVDMWNICFKFQHDRTHCLAARII